MKAMRASIRLRKYSCVTKVLSVWNRTVLVDIHQVAIAACKDNHEAVSRARQAMFNLRCVSMRAVLDRDNCKKCFPVCFHPQMFQGSCWMFTRKPQQM